MHLSLHVHAYIGLYILYFDHVHFSCKAGSVDCALQAIIIIDIHIGKLFVQNHMCILSFSVECHNSTASILMRVL